MKPRLTIGVQELLEAPQGLDAAPLVLARNSRIDTEPRIEALRTIKEVLGEDGFAAQQLAHLIGELLQLHSLVSLEKLCDLGRELLQRAVIETRRHCRLESNALGLSPLSRK